MLRPLRWRRQSAVSCCLPFMQDDLYKMFRGVLVSQNNLDTCFYISIAWNGYGTLLSIPQNGISSSLCKLYEAGPGLQLLYARGLHRRCRFRYSARHTSPLSCTVTFYTHRQWQFTQWGQYSSCQCFITQGCNYKQHTDACIRKCCSLFSRRKGSTASKEP